MLKAGEKTLFIISLILIFTFLLQFFIFIHFREQNRKVFVLMPLITPATEGQDLSRIGLNTLNFLSQTGRLGSTLSLEDLAKGVLLLENNPQLALRPGQKARILKNLKAAYQNLEAIENLRKGDYKLEMELNGIQARIKTLLTPPQVKFIYGEVPQDFKTQERQSPEEMPNKPERPSK
jgi:hypothetical protein